MPETNTVSFVLKARESVRERVGVCMGVSKRWDQIHKWLFEKENGGKKKHRRKRSDYKEKQRFWTPVQRRSIWPLPCREKKKDDSRWRGISWFRSVSCRSPSIVSLSLSERTTQHSRNRIQPQQQHVSACGGAVLDTNLSSANESQTHRPECYSWQSALVVLYERQIASVRPEGCYRNFCTDHCRG